MTTDRYFDIDIITDHEDAQELVVEAAQMLARHLDFEGDAKFSVAAYERDKYGATGDAINEWGRGYDDS